MYFEVCSFSSNFEDSFGRHRKPGFDHTWDTYEMRKLTWKVRLHQTVGNSVWIKRWRRGHGISLVIAPDVIRMKYYGKECWPAIPLRVKAFWYRWEEFRLNSNSYIVKFASERRKKVILRFSEHSNSFFCNMGRSSGGLFHNPVITSNAFLLGTRWKTDNGWGGKCKKDSMRSLETDHTFVSSSTPFSMRRERECQRWKEAKSTPFSNRKEWWANCPNPLASRSGISFPPESFPQSNSTPSATLHISSLQWKKSWKHLGT